MVIILIGQRVCEVCQLAKERERGMMGSVSHLCRKKVFVLADDEILACFLPCLKL